MELIENVKCDACGADLSGFEKNGVTTKQGLHLCNYECMETYYGDDIPDDEEFLIVPN
jgi:hypothetical protein